MEGDGERPVVSAPRAEMRYYAAPSHPFLGMVRAVGALALAFGILKLVMLPVRLMYERSQKPTGVTAKDAFYVLNERLWPFVTVVLSSCLVVAGGACLRRRPRGRGLLLLWAWGVVAWVTYSTAVNGWYMLDWGGRYPPMTIVYTIGYYLEYSVPGLVLPVVVIVMMRQRAVRGVFEVEGDEGG